MPITLHATTFPLSHEAVQQLWAAVIAARHYPDEPVSVRAVSREEMQQLNTRYRGVQAPTNVLTFSYPAEQFPGNPTTSHDIAVCLTVAADEAAQRSVALEEYLALLLVHGMLHATGLDHEHSATDQQATAITEQHILTSCGYSPLAL